MRNYDSDVERRTTYLLGMYYLTTDFPLRLVAQTFPAFLRENYIVLGLPYDPKSWNMSRSTVYTRLRTRVKDVNEEIDKLVNHTFDRHFRHKYKLAIVEWVLAPKGVKKLKKK